MIDPHCGIGTLTFFKKYTPPKKEYHSWSVDRIVEEAFLDVKVPLNTLFALAVIFIVLGVVYLYRAG